MCQKLCAPISDALRAPVPGDTRRAAGLRARARGGSAARKSRGARESRGRQETLRAPRKSRGGPWHATGGLSRTHAPRGARRPCTRYKRGGRVSRGTGARKAQGCLPAGAPSLGTGLTRHGGPAPLTPHGALAARVIFAALAFPSRLRPVRNP
ncbi:LAFE_0A03774g1_1 [Lachancea fermentati]|uniref:LAFE_0A03774g1_1 n=1 Tax=Lachancea fermentati TaxID=4955 RepID=A0A1G4M6J8_LACFM|nr:LAFE_0A03774g1_1 [Lachancea fermentati]